MHVDGAAVYNRQQAPGVMRDRVIHRPSNSKRKSEYTKRVAHTLTNGSTYEALGGTKSLDGLFARTRRNISTVQACRPKAVEERVREFQWCHWIGPADRWEKAGKVISWVP